MKNKDLAKTVALDISIGHLLVVWDVLANNSKALPFVESLGDEEKRAIWALQDRCEKCLTDNGIRARPQAEWNSLIESARVHCKKIPVEFLE